MLQAGTRFRSSINLQAVKPGYRADDEINRRDAEVRAGRAINILTAKYTKYAKGMAKLEL
jgi:hypothetical protein